MAEKKQDYLEVDDSIAGQDWVCMSFISPESMIESKESFKVSQFLQSFCKDKELNYEKCLSQYTDFCYKFSNELQRDYDKKVNFKNNIRGVKVRGVYSTRDEADNRAKKLQKLDSDFHVFVGQVGYWLPWDPCADQIENEHFLNDELNNMMEKYKENNINKDIFYEEEKRDKIKAAKEEVIRKEKEKKEGKEGKEEKEEENNKYEIDTSLDDIKENKDEKDEKDNINIENNIKSSLNDVDPWMSRKLDSEENRQHSEPSPEPLPDDFEPEPEPESEPSPES